MKNVKNVQVRFSEKVYKGMERVAKEDHTTIADVVRKGIQLYGIVRAYQREGKALAIVDKSGKVQAQLLIPGITTSELDEFIRAEAPDVKQKARPE